MTKSSGDAKDRWDSIAREEQLAIAERVAESRAAEFQRLYRNVIGVGGGFKFRSGDFKKAGSAKVVCLIFTLAPGSKGKLSQRGNDPQRIPDRIDAYAKIRGRRRRVSIPSDVVALEPGLSAEHAGGRAAIGSFVRAQGTGGSQKTVLGSNCCVVRNPDFPDDRYVLGCHHVFTRSSVNRCRPMPETELVWRASGGRLGDLAYFTNLTPSPPHYGMDAALVELDDGVTLSNTHGSHTLRRYWTGEGTPPDRFKLCTPAGERAAQYIGKQYKQTFVYSCGANVRIRVAIAYRANTVGGHSGSPVYTPDGTLLGMHFYGTPAGIGYAIPAYALFDAPVFGIDIELV